MKRRVFQLWIISCVFNFDIYHGLQAQDSNSLAVTVSARDKVDSLASAWSSDAPGGIIALIGKGKVIYYKVFGLANVPHHVAVSSNTLFNMGSASKQFTGLAFALLAGRNKLSLDDGVRKYMPQLPACFEPVTIRHLLSHTSGVRDAYNMLALGGKIPNKNILYREDVLKVFTRQRQLENQPGSKWKYNSTAYVLLALILEKITGQPFPIWMHEHIFKPIGMDNTVIETDVEEVIKGAADSYISNGDNKYITSFGNRAFYGAADLYTSIADLAKWGHLFSSPGQSMLEAENLVQQPYILTSGENTSYGMGLFVDTYKGLKRIHHASSHAGYKASFIYFLEIDQGLVTLSNGYPLPSYELADAFFAPYFVKGDCETKAPEAIADSVKSKLEWKPDTAMLQIYAGVYSSEEAEVTFTLRVKDGKLIAKGRWENESNLKPLDKDVFHGEFPFSKIDFMRTKNNRIKGFYLTVNQTNNIWFERIVKDSMIK